MHIASLLSAISSVFCLSSLRLQYGTCLMLIFSFIHSTCGIFGYTFRSLAFRFISSPPMHESNSGDAREAQNVIKINSNDKSNKRADDVRGNEKYCRNKQMPTRNINYKKALLLRDMNLLFCYCYWSLRFLFLFRFKHSAKLSNALVHWWFFSISQMIYRSAPSEKATKARNVSSPRNWIYKSNENQTTRAYESRDSKWLITFIILGVLNHVPSLKARVYRELSIPLAFCNKSSLHINAFMPLWQIRDRREFARWGNKLRSRFFKESRCLSRAVRGMCHTKFKIQYFLRT